MRHITARRRAIAVMFVLAVAVVIDSCDRVQHSHQGVTSSEGVPHQQGADKRYLSVPPPPDCKHLYNNGNHEAWAKCMGVGYK